MKLVALPGHYRFSQKTALLASIVIAVLGLTTMTVATHYASEKHLRLARAYQADNRSVPPTKPSEPTNSSSKAIASTPPTPDTPTVSSHIPTSQPSQTTKMAPTPTTAATSPAPQTPACPYAFTPTGGVVPAGILGPIATTLKKNTISQPVTVDTTNATDKVSWTIEGTNGTPVYATPLSSGVNASGFTFQVTAQSSAVVGQTYWVYINILYPDNSTARYSLPVGIVCY